MLKRFHLYWELGPSENVEMFQLFEKENVLIIEKEKVTIFKKKMFPLFHKKFHLRVAVAQIEASSSSQCSSIPLHPQPAVHQHDWVWSHLLK